MKIVHQLGEGLYDQLYVSDDGLYSTHAIYLDNDLHGEMSGVFSPLFREIVQQLRVSW